MDRLAAIIDALRRAAAGDRGVRLEIPGGPDDLSSLAEAVNSLLDSLGPKFEDSRHNEREAQLHLTQLTIDHASIACFWISRDSVIRYVNDMACQSLGYTKDELVGMSVPDIDPLFSEEQWKTYWQGLTQTKVQTFETTHQRKDGSRFPVEIVAHHIVLDREEFSCAFVRDLTESKRAYQQLKENEQLLRHLQKVAGLGHYIFDAAGGTWQSSDVLDEIFGIDADFPKDVAGWLKIVHPEQRGEMEDYLRDQVLGQGKDFDIEYRIVRQQDGAIRWVHGLGELHRDELGKIISMIGTIQDITSRKQTELDLVQSETHFRTLAEAAFEGVALTRKGIFIELNHQLATMLGSTRQEMIGEPVENYVALQDRERVARHIRQGDAAPYEHLALRKDGTTFPVEARGRQTRIGELTTRITTIRDLTDRKQAEKDLLLTRFCVDNAPVAIYSIDETGRIRFVNEQAARNLGYRVDELCRMDVWDIDPNFTRESWLANRKKIRSQRQGSFETLHRRKDGSLMPVQISVSYLTFDNQEFSFSFAFDLTERKRAEEELRQSEERLRLALQASNQGLYDLNMQTGEARISPEYASMLGYEPAGFIETHNRWLERLHPDDLSRVKTTFQDYVAGRLPAYSVEFRQRTAEGGWKWILSLGRIVEWDEQGNPLRMLGTHTDISDRKLAEETLRQSEERFRSLLERVPTVAIQGYYADGTIFYWNQANETIYGYNSSEAVGRNLVELIIPPAMRDEVRQAVRHGEETGIMPEAAELELLHKNGSLVPVFSSHAVIQVPGKPVEFYCIDIDLKQIKTIEEEKTELEAQLQQAQKLESIGRLAGGIAHDFNNMLSVIFGCVDLIKSRLGEQDGIRRFVDEIEKAAAHSRDVTQQLLAFSRKQVISPNALDLNELISSTRASLARLIGETIEIAFEPQVALWSIRGDRAQIEQVLINLALNARDAMPNGGRLHYGTRNLSLTSDQIPSSQDCQPGDYVELEVRDTGLGMDEETRAHMFEPFFTNKETGKGTGLGLATVYGIVKQNRGFIRVESSPGAGTTISIALPAVHEKASRTAPAIDPELSPGTGTILLVEDDPAVRDITRGMLEAIGYQVLEADHPERALDYLADRVRQITAVVSDVVMPGINGAQLEKEIDRLRPGLPILFISGYTADVIAQRGVLPEDTHFLQKPFTMNQLADSIKRLTTN